MLADFTRLLPLYPCRLYWKKLATDLHSTVQNYSILRMSCLLIVQVVKSPMMQWLVEQPGIMIAMNKSSVRQLRNCVLLIHATSMKCGSANTHLMNVCAYMIYVLHTDNIILNGNKEKHKNCIGHNYLH